MSERDTPDQEDTDGDLVPFNLPTAKGKSGRKAFTRLRRELDDSELSSSAVQRLLLDEVERLEQANTELSGFRDRFYEADKTAAILVHKSKVYASSEIISTACNTVGAVALGYAPAVWSDGITGWLFLIFGSVLIVLSIAAKVLRS